MLTLAGCSSNRINFYQKKDISISLETNGANSFAVVLENKSGHDLYIQNGMFDFIGLDSEGKFYVWNDCFEVIDNNACLPSYTVRQASILDLRNTELTEAQRTEYFFIFRRNEQKTVTFNEITKVYSFSKDSTSAKIRYKGILGESNEITVCF